MKNYAQMEDKGNGISLTIEMRRRKYNWIKQHIDLIKEILCEIVSKSSFKKDILFDKHLKLNVRMKANTYICFCSYFIVIRRLNDQEFIEQHSQKIKVVTFFSFSFSNLWLFIRSVFLKPSSVKFSYYASFAII